MNKRYALLLLLAALVLSSPPAKAQETSADFGDGSVIFGFDNRPCTGALEKALRYNPGSKCMEFCNGIAWNCTNTGTVSSSGSCTAPASCPNVGDVCDDGNAGTTNDPLFAGFMLYGAVYEPLYVTNNNQSTSVQWKTSQGTDDIATDSFTDGKINDSQIPNSTAFPGFKLCKDLTDGGFTDWYVPARDELHLLWQNRAAIDANAAGTFTTDEYGSSTERSNTEAWGQLFSLDVPGWGSKISFGDVRCVRRD